MAKTKEDLIEDIKVLNHNLKCKEETIEIQRRRLEKMWDFLITEEGYSNEAVREMVKLPEEN